MSRPNVKERIREYFLSQGYSGDPVDDNSFLIFSTGEIKTAVKVLSIEDLEDRNVLLQALLQAASKPEFGDKTYVAMPKLLAAVIDGKILEEIGLGLITFNDSYVEEIIPAKTVKSRAIPIRSASTDSPLLKELHILRLEISELRDMVERLKLELRQLKEIGETVKTRKEVKEVKPLEMKVSTSQSSGLPSFFQTNPWLSVLSQRGRETGEIAS